MKKLHILILLVCSVFFVDCLHVQMTSPSLDSDAKKFEPEPGKGNIYINRISQWYGYDFAFQTLLDGRVVGALAPKTYLMLSVAPGKHIVAVSGADNVTQQTVNVESGKNYFFEARCTLSGSNGQYSLRLISEEQGRKEVTDSKRSEGATYQ